MGLYSIQYVGNSSTNEVVGNALNCFFYDVSAGIHGDQFNKWKCYFILILVAQTNLHLSCKIDF